MKFPALEDVQFYEKGRWLDYHAKGLGGRHKSNIRVYDLLEGNRWLRDMCTIHVYADELVMKSKTIMTTDDSEICERWCDLDWDPQPVAA